MTTTATSSSESSSTRITRLFESDLTELGQIEFKKSSTSGSSTTTTTSLSCQVYGVRLSRLLLPSPLCSSLKARTRRAFELKRSRDLIHTVCALYDTCLPDIGAQSVYDCVTAPKSFTVLIVKSDSASLNDLIGDNQEKDGHSSEYSSDDCLSEVENQDEDSTNRPFKNVFSDADDSDDDGDDEDDEEDAAVDNTLGVKSYLKENGLSKESSSKKLPIVRRLVGCATLQRVCTHQLPSVDEWVIDLELLAIRPKYRGLNIGKYLITLAQNRAIVGNFDAVVTCSDSDAVGFYEKHAFSVDPVLNSRYESIGDIWTNTTKMCYIPPYIDFDSNTSSSSSFIDELTTMEREYGRWQKLAFAGYQTQARLFLKLKQEVFALKASLCAKDSLIDDLRCRNDILERQNRLLKLRLNDKEDNDDVNKIISDLENLQS